MSAFSGGIAILTCVTHIISHLPSAERVSKVALDKQHLPFINKGFASKNRKKIVILLFFHDIF